MDIEKEGTVYIDYANFLYGFWSIYYFDWNFIY